MNLYSSNGCPPSPSKATSRMALDLNSPNFDAEYYVQDLLRRKGLEELVTVEQDMVNNVRRLDSEMQSLVYENYSKFLNATSTVKDMQNRLTETNNVWRKSFLDLNFQEMRDLTTRVKRITDLSESLTNKFSKNCEKIKKLNDAKDSVKRLEFLIKAPLILQECIDKGQLGKAVDAYVADLLRRKGLEELVTVEQDMVNNVRRLDSEMQSLVYENYSKFLNATSTVKDMQNRLTETNNEMRDLTTRVKRITDLSESLTNKFSKNCEKIKKLNDAKDSVKRLEFLIKAPLILQECIDKGQLGKAVDAYVAVRPKLEKFRDIPSMSGITKDAEQIADGLKNQFRETLNRRLISTDEVVEAVTMLRKLGDEEKELEIELLITWDREMSLELDQLEANATQGSSRFPDVFEFVDTGCCHFLTNVSLMASTFLQLFVKQTSKAEFIQLLEKAMQRFEQILDNRLVMEKNATECALFVKALDRIYRKISVLTRLSSGFNFSRMNAALVQRFAKHQIIVCRQAIANTIKKTIAELLSKLDHSPPVQSSSRSDNGRTTLHSYMGIRHDRKELLKKTLEKLEQSFVHSVKSSLAALLMFTASDIIFSSIPHFSPIFGFDVHEQIVIGSIQDLVDTIRTIANVDGKEDAANSTEMETKGTNVILLCTLLRNLQLKQLDYLMELCQEQYRLSEFNLSEQQKLTSNTEMSEFLKSAVENLLRRFVEIETNTFTQMLQKSIDVFDWSGCSESPRHVRSLVKHFVHSVEETDKELAVFMDDGGLAKLKERTPDSLRGPSYSTMRRATSAASSVYNDASSVSSGGIVERLWGDTDTLEESGTLGVNETAATVPVEFRRDVILNAIVRLTLKAMCDCVRAQKFSRQGLEQMQVDCAFMRQKLWACVGDEHMLNTLIEDIVTAGVNQCAQPKLLDPSVVRGICEEN